MQFEHLKTAEFLEKTVDDQKYERWADRFRRQKVLVGDAGRGIAELRRLMILIAVCFGCLYGYIQMQGPIRNVLFSASRAKDVVGTMAGQLDQEKKIWDFVEN